jgi:thiol-disulfide isomerase/thioredoxin
MMDSPLDPPLVRMPELGRGTWLNTPSPLSKEQLQGQVVLVDFWDYTCINCIRTLPYMREWNRRYAGLGLTIIGVHTPEFKFAANQEQVAEAAQQFELLYPILIDTQQETWTRFANRAWPTKYIVDSQGYIRFKSQGEGGYSTAEEAIQMLLHQRDTGISLPEIMPPMQPTDATGAVCYRTTPELYAGYQGGGLFGSALGNPEGFVTGGIMMYALPDEEYRHEGQFFLQGFWHALPESLAFAGENGGRVLLPYRAAGVNAVLSPSGDPLELMLGLRASEKTPLVQIKQDGSSLPPIFAGKDVLYDAQGRSYLHIDRPRLYEIVRDQAFSSHELELIFHAGGLALFSFTFNSCVVSGSGADSADTFQRH